MIVQINENQILWETEKAYLIKFPNSKTWKFWVGKKLIQQNMKHYNMYVFDGMEIKLFSDAGNKKIINSDTFLEAFGFDMDMSIKDDLIDN